MNGGLSAPSSSVGEGSQLHRFFSPHHSAEQQKTDQSLFLKTSVPIWIGLRQCNNGHFVSIRLVKGMFFARSPAYIPVFMCHNCLLASSGLAAVSWPAANRPSFGAAAGSRAVLALGRRKAFRPLTDFYQ